MNSHLSVGDRWRVVSPRFDQGIILRNQIAPIIYCSYATVFNILQDVPKRGPTVELPTNELDMKKNDRTQEIILF